jgi:hypothetical protein
MPALALCVSKCFPQPVQILHDLIARLAAQFFNDLGTIFLDQDVNLDQTMQPINMLSDTLDAPK